MSTLSVPLHRIPIHQAILGDQASFHPASLPVSNPTRSFWINSSADANPLAEEGSEGELTGDADICIIGSGITGVSAAYHLAKAVKADPSLGALSAVIVEAREFCE